MPLLVWKEEEGFYGWGCEDCKFVVPSVFFVSDCPDLHYNGVGLDDLSPSDAMPSNRSNLKLDEQYFQGVLSAAFTIQEHNDRHKLARQTPARQTQAEPEDHSGPVTTTLCPQCGALMLAEASRCWSCGLDHFPPEESVQPDWASTWLMDQKQDLGFECPAELREGAQDSVKPPKAKAHTQNSANKGSRALPIAKDAAKEPVTQEKTETIPDRAFDTSALDRAEAKSQRISESTEDMTPGDLAPGRSELTVQPVQSSARADSSPFNARTDAPTDASVEADGASAALLKCVPDDLIGEIVRQAMQATRATGAAIAFGQRGHLICRAATGYSVSEIDALLNTRSGLTGVCAFRGTMQLCSNTALSSGIDADACRRLGVRATIVVPLLHQDQSLGLIAVFSKRPYAFGMRDLQVLEDLAGKFAENLFFIEISQLHSLTKVSLGSALKQIGDGRKPSWMWPVRSR